MPHHTLISLFAGIGGICMGFTHAGVEVVYANEWDTYAAETYRLNFPRHPLSTQDIQTVHPKALPDADIVAAGFPCQAFSIAGYQRGFTDPRGNLFFNTMDIILEKRPRAVFLENVKNLESHDHGKTFQIMSDALTSNGYVLHTQVLNTMTYGGLPQNRERIYVVAFRQREDSSMFEWHAPLPSPDFRTLLEEPATIDDKYYYQPESQYFQMFQREIVRRDRVYQLRRISVRENKKGVCPTLTASMGLGGHNVPLVLDNRGIRKLTPRECFRFQGFPDDYQFPAGMANSHLYKQIGNSVSVPVIERIAHQIVRVLDSQGSSIDTNGIA